MKLARPALLLFCAALAAAVALPCSAQLGIDLSGSEKKAEKKKAGKKEKKEKGAKKTGAKSAPAKAAPAPAKGAPAPALEPLPPPLRGLFAPLGLEPELVRSAS